MHASHTPRRFAVAAVALTAAFACVAANPVSGASSASITVAATVVSASTIDVSACIGSSINFGAMQPGSSLITSSDCAITFGSSNDTASLLVNQTDGVGRAMASDPVGPDATFGAGGTYSVPNGAASNSTMSGFVQADGKLVATNWVSQSNGEPFMLSRYLASGTIDTGFGTNGWVAITISAGQTSTYATAQQPDGKLIVAGFTDFSMGTGNDAAVIRLNTNGSLDTTFGVAGKARIPFSTSTDLAADVVVRPDGRIVVIGQAVDIPFTNFDSAAAQLLPDGSIDTTFGTNGMVVVPIGPHLDENGTHGALDASGRIIIATSVGDGTYAGAGNTFHDIGIERLTTTGAVDTTFNAIGSRIVSVNTIDYGAKVSVGASGDILVTGITDPGAGYDLLLLRLTSTGAFAPGFNGGAPLVVDFGGAQSGYDAFIDSADRVVATTSATIATVSTLVVARFLPTGAPDPAFSGDGIDTLTPAGTSLIRPRRILPNDGGYSIVGQWTVGGIQQPFVGRYNAPTVADYQGATADWAVGANGTFGACLRAEAGTTPTWTVDANATCTAVGTDPWRSIPASTAVPTARIAATGSGVTGSVSLRFGVRVPANQAPGTYRAPVNFSVVAPGL
ncbi:MAG: hypothetical protein H7287_06500 [Thermoleophilia bacterium]|nr:hypothetical protein [Thermoleophilia bacterium]